MRRLVYTSDSLVGSDPDELGAIVDRSSVRNALAGITGMLWFDGKHFAQVLEGPHDAVDQTMRRIRGDNRHTRIETVFDQAVAGKIFGGWGMKLSDTSLECTANTAFLVGLVAHDRKSPGKRLLEIMLACDG